MAADKPDQIFGYKSPNRWPVIVLLIGIWGIGLYVFAVALARGKPLLPASVPFLVLVGGTYFALFKLGIQIEVTGVQLSVRSWFGERQIPVRSIGEITSRFGLSELRVHNSSSILIGTDGAAWSDFLDALNSVHPDRPLGADSASRRPHLTLGRGEFYRRH